MQALEAHTYADMPPSVQMPVLQVPNLSNMHGLAWLSIAGTPACAPAHVPLDVPVLTMDQLDVGPALGDGASGDVFEGYMQGKPVAVKVFKADVSPDGHAQDEIAVASCLDHPNLIRCRPAAKAACSIALQKGTTLLNDSPCLHSN